MKILKFINMLLKCKKDMKTKHQLKLNTLIFFFMLGIGQLVADTYFGNFMKLQQVLELLFFVPWSLSTLWILKNIHHTIYRKIAVLFLTMFAVGYGMHTVANQLSSLPAERLLNDIIYFYDEILSHYIMWASYFGIIFFLIFFNNLKESIKEKDVLFTLVAISHGGLVALSCIEAQSVIILITYLLALGILPLLRKSFWRQLKISPIGNYYVISAITSVIILILWGIAFQGFPEPSTLGLIK